MITSTKYQCEICETLYDEETQCRECESSHIGVDEIAKLTYDPIIYGNSVSCYPKSVTLKMEDGELLTFKR